MVDRRRDATDVTASQPGPDARDNISSIGLVQDVCLFGFKEYVFASHGGRLFAPGHTLHFARAS